VYICVVDNKATHRRVSITKSKLMIIAIEDYKKVKRIGKKVGLAQKKEDEKDEHAKEEIKNNRLRPIGLEGVSQENEENKV
jgi:hypothetical protein